MRAFGGMIAALWLSACSTSETPALPLLPGQGVRVESDLVLAPSEPTPAFVPAREGACPPAYRPVEGSCVHQAYVATDDALARELDAYKRGAVPPMLGPRPKAAPPPPEKRPLDPGALAKRGGADAGVARDRRLAELDAMIAVAKEKLRERDENSRARRVDSPRRAAPAAPAALAPAPSSAGSFGATAPGGADPTQARLSELSQLTSQLPPEQVRAITAQLSQAGLDMRELEQLLQSARSGQ